MEIIIAIIASGGAWSLLNTGLQHILKRFDKKKDLLDVHGAALRGLLYGELERRLTAYIRSGSISAGELNSIRKYYYEPYKELDGDGVIDALMERVEKLDIKNEEE
jgi:hypothetical protein